MSNSWFAFKQFKIVQDKTAMKVGTDSVLLGTWIDVVGAKSVLDIGTGTGLIALMLAQRNGKVLIDAIDIDVHACKQAEENIASSPWSGRINVVHSSLSAFTSESTSKYDLIVCNPPYFINSKRSQDTKRRIARHADELMLEDLFRDGSRLLNETGVLGIVFPYDEKERLISTAAGWGLYPQKILNIKHSSGREYVRVLISFNKIKNNIVTEDEIDIETGVRHQYTKEFSELVRDFYLYVD